MKNGHNPYIEQGGRDELYNQIISVGCTLDELQPQLDSIKKKLLDACEQFIFENHLNAD